MKNKRYKAVFTVILMILFFTAASVCAADKPTKLDLTPREEAYIASHGSLKVGYVQDRKPISFSDKNGELSGVLRYLFDHIAKISGLEFEYVPLPNDEVTYDYLLSNDFDLVTSVEYNKENQNARGILISDPYIKGRKVVVAKDDINFSYDAALSVAISTGSQTLRKVFDKTYPNFVLKDYDSVSDCFDAVNNGEADLLIQNQYVVEYWISRPKYENLKVMPIMGLDDLLCFSAVVEFGDHEGNSQEDGQILISILNKAIHSMSEDEVGSFTIQGIMENQYQYTMADFLVRYRYSVGIFFLLFFIIVVLLLMLGRQRLRFAETRADARAKEQFLSTMSHEIRTPLNGLIGLNYLMSQHTDDLSRLNTYLDQSTVTAKYLLSLVNDILDTSKLQAQKLELVMHPVELELTLDTVCSLVKSAMNEKRLTFNVDIDTAYPCILGDEVRIQQVLLNLLDNARKFTPEGGSVSLSLRQEKTEDNKILTKAVVSDTGCGMSEDFQKRIFDLFTQELGTVSKGNQGTGLGLFISRRLALLMNGELSVESRKGKGSSFTFTFVSEIAEPVAKTGEQNNYTAKDLPRVLVAEDNELNGEIMLELLENKGYKAELVKNGKEAYERFRDSEPYTYGVILMDLLMPEMDGYEATAAIRALSAPDAKTVRILACTANSFADDREKAKQCGMNDFIAKPIDIDELFKKLR